MPSIHRLRIELQLEWLILLRQHALSWPYVRVLSSNLEALLV